MMLVTYDVNTSDAAGQKRLRKVAKLCERYGLRVQNSVFELLVDAAQLAALKAEGYRIVATTPHRGDHTPETFDVAAGPFALVFGTEHAGISDEVIAAADEFLRIPMCGMVESLNVSASAAILIYMLSERVRLMVPGWRMDDAAQAEVLYRWMTTSVRDAAAILEKRFPEK